MHTPEPLRAIINRHRLTMSARERNSAPHVVQAVLSAGLIGADYMEQLARGGLADIVRALIKGSPLTDNGRSSQIGLWEPHQQSIVNEIGRETVYVPSRDAFVELLPGLIEADEAIEAGHYLHAEGNATIRRGDLLILLGASMRDDTQHKGAA